MNFIEAMRFVYENSNVLAVRRKGWDRNGFVWHDKNLFLGKVPFGFRYETKDRSDVNAFCPNPEDVFADDWEQYTP